jgi:hypothetical protein
MAEIHWVKDADEPMVDERFHRQLEAEDCHPVASLAPFSSTGISCDI